jgi:DNA-binding response OmpR family regulator
MKDLLNSRIFIIDDEPTNIELLEKTLQRQSFTNILSTTKSARAFELFVAFEPDIILLDLRMPVPDGYSLLLQFKESRPLDEYLPVVILTADITKEARHKALALGAHDFLNKPLDTVEVILRVWNLLETRALYKRLKAVDGTFVPVKPDWALM